MSIDSDGELEQAVAEFQTLRDEDERSAGGKRRRELDAAIKAYYARHGNDLRPGKPRSLPNAG